MNAAAMTMLRERMCDITKIFAMAITKGDALCLNTGDLFAYSWFVFMS